MRNASAFRSGRWLAVLLAISGLWACSGSIGQSSGEEPPGTADGTPATGKPGPSAVGANGGSAGDDATDDDEPGSSGPKVNVCKAGEPDPGPAPLQRLSRTQYANTVRDLFGVVPDLEASLSGTDDAYEFGLVQADVAPVDLENYQAAAERVATFATSDAQRLSAIAPCASADEPRTCARKFVQTFGARVYRAPLRDDTDVDRHLALFDAGAATSYAHGVELVLRGMLQAPRFLYRVELGTDDAQGPRAIALSGHEVAARLSYMVWNSTPDAALDEAASQGELDTQAGVADALAAMLADPKGEHALRGFLERWLQLPRLDAVVKDETLFPDWASSNLRTSMRTQAQRFLDDVLDHEDGTLTTLLTSSTVFVNKDLAAYYDVKASTDSFAALETSDGRASGVLTLPAFLALMAKPAESSPIYRGKFVREALLCHTLPAPPPNIPKPPDVKPGVSTRERLAQHEVDPACSGCHHLMDPIGFGFENFDAVGRYRTEDGGDAVDGRGELIDTLDVDGAFTGVAELGQKLASSDQVTECIARQWFRFALSRYERDVDACSIEHLVSAFESAGGDLNVLPRALVETDAFRYRHPLAYEESP